uniref:Protein RETICULATA, chloroplastic n=2 Tax=Magnoliopsida TaxID=3398 RepID=A0A1D1Y057_9ARAE
MAFAASPSSRLCGSSRLSSDFCLDAGPVSRCQVKSITFDVRGFVRESSPSFGCRLHVKEANFAVSIKHYRCNASSLRKTRNYVIRGELGPIVEEPHVAGEPTGPRIGASPERGDGPLPLGNDPGAPDISTHLHHDNGNGSGDSSDGAGGNGEFPPGGGGGGSGDNNNDRHGENEEEDEFGPVLRFEEVMKETKARGVSLPSDMYEAAKTVGIQKVFLDNYMSMEELAWPLGAAIRWCPFLRDRMLADRQFLFKVGTEIVIDSCCATFAEVQKRGKDFWAEFELYTADLLVGVVVNVALVGLLAPYARIGQPSTSKGLFSHMARVCGALPSSVFEAERPGCRFSVQQRIGTFFYKGILYGSVGFVCGLVGQGIANMIMTAKRSVKKSEEDIPVPPLVRSAALWGVFLAVSSNTRYQIINGLERIVESSTVARRVPPVAMAFTVGVRFANNIYGGMQFVDWARWSGCQ